MNKKQSKHKLARVWPAVAMMAACLAGSAAVLAAPPIRCPSADGGEDQGERRRRPITLPQPGFDQCLLHHVLRIRLAAASLAGKEQQSRSVGEHPTFPLRLFRHLICGTAIHAISAGKASPLWLFV